MQIFLDQQTDIRTTKDDFARMAWCHHHHSYSQRTDEVAFLVAGHDDVAAVEQHLGALLLAALDQRAHALLRRRADERAQVRLRVIAWPQINSPCQLHMLTAAAEISKLSNISQALVYVLKHGVSTHLVQLSASSHVPGTQGSIAWIHPPRWRSTTPYSAAPLHRTQRHTAARRHTTEVTDYHTLCGEVPIVQAA